MAHPNDATLQLTLGRGIRELHQRKVEELIRKPTERSAGYIDALRDVLRIMYDGQMPDDLDQPTHHPSQEQTIGG